MSTPVETATRHQNVSSRYLKSAALVALPLLLLLALLQIIQPSWWYRRTGNAPSPLAGHKFPISCLAFSPDGKTLAGGGGDDWKNGELCLWNVNSKKLLRRWTSHDRLVTELAFSPDGKLLASGSLDGAVNVWNLRNGKLKATLAPLDWVPATQTKITELARDPRTGELNESVLRQHGVKRQSLGAGSYNFVPDGTRPLAIFNEGLNGKRTVDPVLAMAFSRDGTTLRSTQSNMRASLWNVNGRLISTTSFGTNGSIAMLGEYSRDGEMLVMNTMSSMRTNGGKPMMPPTLWSVRKQPRPLDARFPHFVRELPLDSIERAAFSPDGNHLAVLGKQSPELSSGPAYLEVVNVQTSASLWKHRDAAPTMQGAIAFSPDGRTLGMTQNSNLILYDAANGNFLGKVRGLREESESAPPANLPIGHEAPREALTFSPDGRRAASSSGSDVTLWHVPRVR